MLIIVLLVNDDFFYFNFVIYFLFVIENVVLGEIVVIVKVYNLSLDGFNLFYFIKSGNEVGRFVIDRKSGFIIIIIFFDREE